MLTAVLGFWLGVRCANSCYHRKRTEPVQENPTMPLFNIAAVLGILSQTPGIVADIKIAQDVLQEIESKDSFGQKEQVFAEAIEQLFPEYKAEETAAQEVVSFALLLLHLNTVGAPSVDIGQGVSSIQHSTTTPPASPVLDTKATPADTWSDAPKVTTGSLMAQDTPGAVIDPGAAPAQTDGAVDPGAPSTTTASQIFGGSQATEPTGF